MGAIALAEIISTPGPRVNLGVRMMDNMPLADQLEQQTGVSLAALLAPIEEEQRAGVNVRSNGVFHAIQSARRADDPTLPMGQWEHDLKQADWDEVVAVATQALQEKTKDLQLAVWLLEAQIHRWGLAGIAPTVLLIQQLCEEFWEELYPPVREGDLEYRVNIFRWVNEKLLTPIKLIPLTRCDRKNYGWSDWEVAQRNDQLRAQMVNEAQIEGATLGDIQQAFAGTDTDFLEEQHRVLTEALDALYHLNDCLDRYCGDEAPSLGALSGLLSDIRRLNDSELDRRGYRFQGADSEDQSSASSHSDGSVPGGVGGNGGGSGPITSRADAYRHLATVADYLSQIEPHSPVPALLNRAVEWGNMSTAELYHQLFIESQGQLNIFDLLGIAASER